MAEVWIRQSSNTGWQDSSQASIRLHDRGFQYGDGLFETLSIRNGRILHAKQHLQRLGSSLAELGFVQAADQARQLEEEIGMRLSECISRNQIDAAGVAKVMVSRGASARGFAPPLSPCLTVVVEANPCQSDDIRVQTGLTAVLGTQPVFSKSLLVRHKTLSSLEKIMARKEAQQAGVDECILVNELGQVTEATSANLFLVRERKLFTPPVECGLLPGVTRRMILDICRKRGYAVEEVPLSVSDLQSADEVWLTNSVSGIMRLQGIAGVSEYRTSVVFQEFRFMYEALSTGSE